MDKKFLEFTKENNINVSDEIYCCWLHGYGSGQFRYIHKLLKWAEGRKSEETNKRPNNNIYKPVLITTWNQIIRKIGGKELIERVEWNEFNP